MLSLKPEGAGGAAGLSVAGSAALSLLGGLDGDGFLPRPLAWGIFSLHLS